MSHETTPTRVDGDATAARAWSPTALPPLLDSEVAHVAYHRPDWLRQWVERYGSPLHVVWPKLLERNAEALQAVPRRHGVALDVYYGAKVNKSQALVRAAVEAGIGVDVSSEYEMQDALLAGIDPRRLVATGPAKTARFHGQLVARGALISVDSLEEFEALQQNGASGRARVLLRCRPASARASRFGMGEADVTHCLRTLAASRDRFAFEGFHFHLSGYDVASRVQALREVMSQVAAARELGLGVQVIDIGGGLPIRYVDAERYAAFLRSQDATHYRNGKLPTSFYPYGGELDAAAWLDELLGTPLDATSSVAEALIAQGLRLAIEPGRSLVDQAAITVFRVNRVKALADGRHVVYVEGSSFSACETWFASEYLVDPILLSFGAPRGEAPMRAYIAGHSCLDDDVITNRLIDFATKPEPGDLLVYANTAGYQMDLLENEFHRHPMPRRIAVRNGAAGGMEVWPDDKGSLE
ncbi:Y4yA family PLP-dependent enzyme [Roseateles sp. BYS96W]|uniref:Y4yA family PLP-dependent enzyme n=1 Tax=Pelomonas nitida TaxID=3299027 RepID=A0ABW7G1M9_9BURK